MIKMCLNDLKSSLLVEGRRRPYSHSELLVGSSLSEPQGKYLLQLIPPTRLLFVYLLFLLMVHRVCPWVWLKKSVSPGLRVSTAGVQQGAAEDLHSTVHLCIMGWIINRLADGPDFTLSFYWNLAERLSFCLYSNSRLSWQILSDDSVWTIKETHLKTTSADQSAVKLLE